MRNRTLAVALVGVVALAVIAIPVPAFAASPGTLTVQLETPAHSSLALGGINVNIREKKGTQTTYNSGGNTDASGKLTFTAVPASSSLSVVVGATSGYLAHTESGLTLSSGQSKTVRLPLAHGATISGNLIGGSGALAGADVALLDSKGVVVRYVTTNSSGNYSIDGIASGSYRVQFNSRFEDSVSVAARTYTWSYWKGANTTGSLTWSGAKKLSLKQQGAHSNASVVTGVNGAVFAGDSLTASVTYWNPASSHAGQNVIFVGQHAADGFRARLGSDGNLSVQLNPGKYRIAILGDYDSILAKLPYYWYVSDSKGPTTSVGNATWVTVSGSTRHITFVPTPGDLD